MSKTGSQVKMLYVQSLLQVDGYVCDVSFLVILDVKLLVCRSLKQSTFQISFPEKDPVARV